MEEVLASMNRQLSLIKKKLDSTAFQLSTANIHLSNSSLDRLQSLEAEVEYLNTVERSATQWQRSWFKRTFHRWRAPQRPSNTMTDRQSLAWKPHEAAVASYASWQSRFDTPTAFELEMLEATAADLPEILIFARFSAPSEHLIERTVAALRMCRGVRWNARFCFDPSCTPQAMAHYRSITQDDSRFHSGELGPRPGESLVVLLEGGALPRPHGPRILVEALLQKADSILSYSDEDQLSPEGLPEQPWFKPTYSRLLAEQGVLYGRMLALRASEDGLTLLINQFSAPEASGHTLAHAIVRDGREDQVVHVPHVLYHNVLPAPAPLALPLPPLPALLPFASILIPTRNGWDLLGPCLASLKKTDWPADRLEIIVVDNGSNDPQALAEMAAAESSGQIRLLRDPSPFNYSRLNNLAARAARGDLLVLLNNDTEIIDPAWLRKLAAYAMQPGAGAVGPKLLYPDRTVQHGGVALGIRGGGGHLHTYLGANEGGYHGLANMTREIAAVTGACLALTRSAFDEVGGLNETLHISYNDVVLCLDLHARGRRNIYIGEPLLIHHESKTRGKDDTPEKIRILRSEVGVAWNRHKALLKNDPFYSPNLSLETTHELAFAPRRRPAWRSSMVSAPKVMILSSIYAEGHGVAVVIALQIRALLAKGYDVVLAGRPSKRDFHLEGHKVIEVLDERSAATLAVDLGINLIVAHTPPYFGVATWTGEYPPVLAYDYGEPTPDFFPDSASRRQTIEYKNLVLRSCSRVIAISEAVANESIVSPDRIIPLGNNYLGQWSPAMEDRRTKVRRQRHWEAAYVVLNICRFHMTERSYKGVDQYADLLKTLKSLDPNLAARSVFVLCGKADREDVEAMKSLGLHVLANVTDDEMTDLYAAADLYVNFSRWEGYNLGIGQALAMGLTVLASDIPAHRAFGVKTTNRLENAAAFLRDQAIHPAKRFPKIWEWHESLTMFMNEVDSLVVSDRHEGS